MTDVLTPLTHSQPSDDEIYESLPLNSPEERGRVEDLEVISLAPPAQPEAPPGGNESSAQVRRGVLAFTTEAIWFGIVNVALLVALAIDWNNECEGAFDLKKWAQIEIVIQTLMLFSGWAMHSKMARPPAETRTPALAALYIIHRLLNMFWIIWSITGIVWTFDSKTCSGSMPVIYTVCLILAIVNIVILGLPVLVCCCSIPVTILTYCCCPSLFGVKPPKKASPRLIKSVTVKKSYKEDMMNKDDANCAICLCEYEPRDDLRFLRCGHHFHDECIMQWLVKNKTCPFCKKEIDQVEESKPSDKEEVNDHVTIEISQLPSQAEPALTELEEYSDDEIPLTNPHLQPPV